MDEFSSISDALLRQLLDRLQSSEADMAVRLTVRLDVVDDASDPMRDSAYRGTADTLDRVKAQRAKVQRELRRRAARADWCTALCSSTKRLMHRFQIA